MSMAEFLQIPLAFIAAVPKTMPAPALIYQKSSYKNVDTLPSVAFYLFKRKCIQLMTI